MQEMSGIWLPDADDHFAGQLRNGPMVDGRATYQYRKYVAALMFVEDRALACDVGAHVGLWSRVMARDFRHVHAFEPVQEHRDCFRRNVQAANVCLHAYAIGSHVGRVHLSTGQSNSGGAHIVKTGEDAPLRPLDNFAHLLKGVTFLKIDVEGYEYEVITGAEQVIRKHRPVIVLEQKPGHAERYGQSQRAALNLLVGWGAKERWEISGDHCLTWP